MTSDHVSFRHEFAEAAMLFLFSSLPFDLWCFLDTAIIVLCLNATTVIFKLTELTSIRSIAFEGETCSIHGEKSNQSCR